MALNGGEKFTKLDLSEAYLQIELEDESKQYLVVNTHRGLYQFNRLPYGVASAPAIFQQIVEQILPKIPGLVYYIDDILVTGRNDDEHLEHLEAVFQSLKQYGFRIKKKQMLVLPRLSGIPGQCGQQRRYSDIKEEN